MQQGIPVLNLDYPNYYERLKNVRKVLKKENPDVVLSFLYGANILACLVKASLFKKFRLIVSDRTGIIKPPRLKDRIRYLLYFFYADAIIANSSDIANKIKKSAPYLSRRLNVIWNILEMPNPSSSNPGRNEFVILTGASYRKIKNPHNWLLAVSKFVKKIGNNPQNLKVYWFGSKMLPKNQEYISELQKIITKNDLQEKVFLNGETKNLIQKIHTADFCSLPSFYEGCPNFVIEAMALSKPVLLSDVCSNRDIITESKGGFFFAPDDVDSICEAIEKAFNSTTEERMRMGKYNYKKAEQMFSVQSNTNKVIKLIEGKEYHAA